MARLSIPTGVLITDRLKRHRQSSHSTTDIASENDAHKASQEVIMDFVVSKHGPLLRQLDRNSFHEKPLARVMSKTQDIKTYLLIIIPLLAPDGLVVAVAVAVRLLLVMVSVDDELFAVSVVRPVEQLVNRIPS